MEETAIPLHSWFWLVVPMSAVFLLSIVNYLRYRNPAKPADHIHKQNKPDGQNEHLSHQSGQYSNNKEGPGKETSQREAPEKEASQREAPQREASGKPRASDKDPSSG